MQGDGSHLRLLRSTVQADQAPVALSGSGAGQTMAEITDSLVTLLSPSPSPSSNSGDPSAVAVGQLDLVGNPRSLDSNLDCVAAPEVGAYEKTGLSAPCPPAALGGGGGTGGPAGSTAVAAPLLTALSLSNRTFRVGGASIAARRRAPRGTRIRFTVDKPGRATATIDRALPGRLYRGRCRRPTRALRSRRRCTRYVRQGAFAFPAAQGRNSVRWSGHLRRRVRGRLRRVPLASGRYRLRLVVRDAEGRASRERRVSFAIVGR